MDTTSGTIKRRAHHFKSPSAVKSAVRRFDGVDTKLLTQSMKKLFPTWIHETFIIFSPTGNSVTTRHFWESQVQFELDHRLWQKDFLDREPTDEERDWLTESVLTVHWPLIQDTLRRRRLILPFPELVAGTHPELQVQKKKTKLRRAFASEEMMERMNIDDDHKHGVGDEVNDVLYPDLEVWNDIVDTTSLERELEKVAGDEKVRWMRSAKPVCGFQKK
jgi:hypothetical protein